VDIFIEKKTNPFSYSILLDIVKENVHFVKKENLLEAASLTKRPQIPILSKIEFENGSKVLKISSMSCVQNGLPCNASLAFFSAVHFDSIQSSRVSNLSVKNEDSPATNSRNQRKIVDLVKLTLEDFEKFEPLVVPFVERGDMFCIPLPLSQDSIVCVKPVFEQEEYEFSSFGINIFSLFMINPDQWAQQKERKKVISIFFKKGFFKNENENFF
jgi:hypothetical protein